MEIQFIFFLISIEKEKRSDYTTTKFELFELTFDDFLKNIIKKFSKKASIRVFQISNYYPCKRLQILLLMDKVVSLSANGVVDHDNYKIPLN